jgi:hypothetical protein
MGFLSDSYGLGQEVSVNYGIKMAFLWGGVAFGKTDLTKRNSCEVGKIRADGVAVEIAQGDSRAGRNLPMRTQGAAQKKPRPGREGHAPASPIETNSQTIPGRGMEQKVTSASHP